MTGDSTSRRATGSASTARPASSTIGRAADGRGPLRGPARAPDDPRLGRRDPPDGRLDERRQARGGRPGPALRRPGHRPVPDRAHVPRGRAARDRPRRDPRRPAARPGRAKAERPPRRRPASLPRGEAARDEPTDGVATFDAAMAKLEGLQQGDFEGIFRAMDGLPVVIRLIDPPLHEFLPNLEEQLVKVTRAEDARRRLRGGQGAARDDPVDARAEPDARAPRLPPRADDPGLREGPDPGDPQRPDRGQARAAATRSRRS